MKNTEAQLDYKEFWSNLDYLNESDVLKYSTYLRPECRSSTIFPVFRNEDTETKIEFLSYWVRKHGIKVVLCLTFRELGGKVLSKRYKLITRYSAMTILVSENFEEKFNGFCGSIEAEIFSELPPRFTFPALSISFSNNRSASVVHSSIRTYNEREKVIDYAIAYPQTGFDIDLKNGNRNYICFFGDNKEKYNLRLQLSEGVAFKEYSVSFINQCHGQTHIVYLEEVLCDEGRKLFKQPRCLIEHDLVDVFPRFYVGIINENLAPTLTHTFFDTSVGLEAKENSGEAKFRAVNENSEIYFDSSFIIPIYPRKNFHTSLRSYAQNLSVSGFSEVRIYSPEGDVLFSRSLNEHELNQLSSISEFDVTELVESMDFPHDKPCAAFFGFVDRKSPFPKRFKLGLNVKKQNTERGSNICFGPPVLMGENTLSKPFTRRWFPLGGPHKFIASIHNTELTISDSPVSTNCSIEFINANGGLLTRKVEMKSNSSLFIDTSTDTELESFFADQVGWCMINAETYVVDAYYFSTLGEQIGGDHAY